MRNFAEHPQKRLGESFKLVGDNLEKGISSPGKTQLTALFEVLLSPDQYAANVRPHPRRGEIVAFAVRLPAKTATLERLAG